MDRFAPKVPKDKGRVFIVELLMDKEHYRPSEVDFYVGDTETAPVSVEQDPVANAISEDGTEEEPEIDASLPTLLLVEDNKDLCQLIKLQLEDKFNIHIANNGVEGLKESTSVSSGYCSDRSDDARNGWA